MGNKQSHQPGTAIHNAIILPGGTMRFYCKNGLSSIDVYNIQKLYNFGGSMKFVNCDTGSQWVALHQATYDMYDRYRNTFIPLPFAKTYESKKRQFDNSNKAYRMDEDVLRQYEKTDAFKQWIGKDSYQHKESEALMKHLCGKKLPTDLAQKISLHLDFNYSSVEFKHIHCPEKVL